MQDINTVSLTGNLTRDPELTQLNSGNSVCKMRVANNGRKKVGEEWVDAPNFFDVVVWGAQGENAAQYLSKGRKVGISGTLRWREWEQDDGTKRQAVEIHANNVAFLGGGEAAGNGNGATASAEPVAAATASGDSDIPF